MPLRLAADDSSFTLGPAPLPPAARNQAAGGHTRQAEEESVQKYPIDYFHVDIAEVNTEEGRLHLFVGIDRTSKFAYAELHEQKKRATAVGFFRRLTEVVPYQIHTVLTDNGIQFTNRKQDRWAFRHLFDRVCHEHGIEHRLTPHEYICHQWQKMPDRFRLNPHHHTLGPNA